METGKYCGPTLCCTLHPNAVGISVLPVENLGIQVPFLLSVFDVIWV